MIEWCHQVRDVLSKSSAQPLLEGGIPGPLVEIDFWKARCADLESIVDQVRLHTCVILRAIASTFAVAWPWGVVRLCIRAYHVILRHTLLVYY